MALLDNGLKKALITGLGIGIGIIVVAPVVIPVIAGAAKPLTKAAIKTGLILYKKGRETMAETLESMEDIVAEAKAEIATAPKEAESDISQKTETPS